MSNVVPFILGILFASIGVQPAAEAPPPAVKQVLDGYLKAIERKDVKAMAKYAGVPWLHRDRQIIRNRAELKGALKFVLPQLPADQGQRKIETLSYKTIRKNAQPKDSDDSKLLSKLLDELLGDDGWLIIVEEEGYPLSMRNILIRVKDDKAEVVGGPLKPNQVMHRNRIPESAERLLAKSETFVLFSLDPEFKLGEKADLLKNAFHGWKVLGKTEIKTPRTRGRLADSLRQAAEDNSGMVAACFRPRHGIRLKDADKVVDLVICFECFSVQVYMRDKREKGFLTTRDPQPVFDAILKEAGIRLPNPAKN